MTDRHPVFIRTLNGLQPWNVAASESLKGLALGVKVKATVSRPRNLAHHNLYWVLVDKVAEALGRDAEQIHYVIKLYAGLTVPIRTKRGVVEMPDSISWAKMDQAAFSKFYEKAVQVICEEWLPHMKPSDLVKEIEGMVAA